MSDVARILVIDTATPVCSVALVDGGRLIAATHETVGRGHAERLVPMIAALPGGGRAGRILVDVGPGSFTGIRVGVAAAKGLAIGWGAPVAGYSSLALVAARAIADGCATPLAVVLEGGHGEVFMQTFAAPLRPLDAPRSLTPAAARDAIGGAAAIGDGLRWLTSDDPRAAPAGALPVAADAILLPADLTALPATPLYVRAPDAKGPAR